MRDLAAWLNRLEAAARDDLAAQERLRDLLNQQSDAVSGRHAEALSAVTEAIQMELGRAPKRKTRRDEIIAVFARHWDVPASALTLGSVVERYGKGAERLGELRASLREVTASVVRLNRRVGALLGLHRRVNQELLEALLADENGSPLRCEGSLVDAEV